MKSKRVPDVIVDDFIYFCRRWWLVIGVSISRYKTTLTLALPHSSIKQIFDNSTFVFCEKPAKVLKQEFTKKEVIDWIKKTSITFENDVILQIKRQQHFLKKGGKTDDSINS